MRPRTSPKSLVTTSEERTTASVCAPRSAKRVLKARLMVLLSTNPPDMNVDADEDGQPSDDEPELPGEEVLDRVAEHGSAPQAHEALGHRRRMKSLISSTIRPSARNTTRLA